MPNGIGLSSYLPIGWGAKCGPLIILLTIVAAPECVVRRRMVNANTLGFEITVMKGRRDRQTSCKNMYYKLCTRYIWVNTQNKYPRNDNSSRVFPCRRATRTFRTCFRGKRNVCQTTVQVPQPRRGNSLPCPPLKTRDHPTLSNELIIHIKFRHNKHLIFIARERLQVDLLHDMTSGSARVDLDLSGFGFTGVDEDGLIWDGSLIPRITYQ